MTPCWGLTPRIKFTMKPNLNKMLDIQTCKVDKTLWFLLDKYLQLSHSYNNSVTLNNKALIYLLVTLPVLCHDYGVVLYFSPLLYFVQRLNKSVYLYYVIEQQSLNYSFHFPVIVLKGSLITSFACSKVLLSKSFYFSWMHLFLPSLSCFFIH